MTQSGLNPNTLPENESDLELREVLVILRADWRLIVAGTFLAAMLSVVYLFFVPNMYTSESVLIAVSDERGASGLNSATGDLLMNAAGINLKTSGKMSPGDVALVTMESRDFLKHLLTFDGVLPNLVAIDKFDEASQSSIFDPNIYDETTNTWVTGMPSYLDVFQDYKDIITTNFDGFRGIVTVSVEHESPQFAYEFLNLIIQEVNNLSRERDLTESEKALDYLYTELSGTTVKDIQLSISQLITSQLNTQMLANVKTDYLIQAFDKPYLPIRQSSPQRSKIFLLASTLGLILSVIGVLILYIVKKYRYREVSEP